MPGDSRSLHDVYCPHILAGRLPRLIPDTSLEPLAAGMPITRDTPIGSHVSVPITREDGSVYGMFCCLSPRPNTSLNPRDLEIMELFASLSAEQVNGALHARQQRETKQAALRSVLEDRDFDIVLQPISNLETLLPSGFEALCRFRPQPYRSPDKWFADAAKRSLVAAMVHFAAETGSMIVAEGIETEAELQALRGLGVHRGQGWHLGRPGDLATALALCSQSKVA